jgi:hypothetical protein
LLQNRHISLTVISDPLPCQSQLRHNWPSTARQRQQQPQLQHEISTAAVQNQLNIVISAATTLNFTSQSIAAIAIPRPIDNATVRFISPGMYRQNGHQCLHSRLPPNKRRKKTHSNSIASRISRAHRKRQQECHLSIPTCG